MLTLRFDSLSIEWIFNSVLPFCLGKTELLFFIRGLEAVSGIMSSTGIEFFQPTHVVLESC